MSDKSHPKSLNYAVKDGISFSVMSGIGESYLSAYAIFLMATNFQVGLLASLPQLIGSLSQFISVKVLNLVKDRKKVILFGVILQAIIWIPILSISLFFKSNLLYLLIIFITAYYIVGNFATPAWNSLMGDIVDSESRGRYFGHRSKLMSISSFFSLCMGGIILHYADLYKHPLYGFVIIFFLAALARMASGYFITRIKEPEYIVNKDDDFSLWSFIRRARGSNFARFTLFTAFMHFSVFLAAPYISVYLLRDLKITYLQFMIINAAMAIAHFLTFNYWGKIGDRFGNKKVIMLTGFMMPLVPILWMLSSEFFYLILIQFVAGFVWSGLSLSMSNFIFDLVTPPKRAKCVAIFNLFNTAGILLGAFTGSLLSSIIPAEFSISGIHISMGSNLLMLFLVSGIARFMTSLVLIRRFTEVREVPQISLKDLIYKTYRSSILPPVRGLIRIKW